MEKDDGLTSGKVTMMEVSKDRKKSLTVTKKPIVEEASPRKPPEKPIEKSKIEKRILPQRSHKPSNRYNPDTGKWILYLF